MFLFLLFIACSHAHYLYKTNKIEITLGRLPIGRGVTILKKNGTSFLLI